MKLILFLSTVILGSQAFTDEEIRQQWLNFKVEHNKLYRSALEERKRFAIFRDNLKEIEAHNALSKAGNESYEMGVTPFADLTEQEFLDYVGQSLHYEELRHNDTEALEVEEEALEAAPASIDWRKKGAVTGVKNQGSCGSCWSFSATGAMEGRAKIKKGKLLSLSEQNLVDCSAKYGNHGCNGGWMTFAFRYVKDHGIASEAKYPYRATQGKCQKKGSVLKVAGFANVKANNENALKNAVAQGPVSVAICATRKMQLYKKGVLHDNTCSKTKLNHGVLVVGYGKESGKGGKNYWIVKNSWSAKWGEKGYIRIIRGVNNCGIAAAGSYPKI